VSDELLTGRARGELTQLDSAFAHRLSEAARSRTREPRPAARAGARERGTAKLAPRIGVCGQRQRDREKLQYGFSLFLCGTSYKAQGVIA